MSHRSQKALLNLSYLRSNKERNKKNKKPFSFDLSIVRTSYHSCLKKLSVSAAEFKIKQVLH